MFKVLRSISLIAAVLAITVVSACGSDGGSSASGDRIAKIKDSGKLRIGVASFKPDNFMGSDGKWQGSMVDLAKDIAKEWGVKPVFVSTTFENIVAGLQANQFDIALDLTQTPERAKVITFSMPIYVSVDNLVVKRGGPQTWEDATTKDRKICAAKGSANEMALKATKVPAQLVGLASSDDCYLQLASGRVDGVWNQWLNTSEYVRANQDYGVLYPPSAADFASTNLGVAKQWSAAAVKKLDGVIGQLITSKGGWYGYTKAYQSGKPTDGAIGELPQYAVDAADAK